MSARQAAPQPQWKVQLNSRQQYSNIAAACTIGLVVAEMVSEIADPIASTKAGILAAMLLYCWRDFNCTFHWGCGAACRALIRLPRGFRCLPPVTLFTCVLHVFPGSACYAQTFWYPWARIMCAYMLSKFSTRLLGIHLRYCRLATVVE
jgi:hypothetical protein